MANLWTNPDGSQLTIAQVLSHLVIPTSESYQRTSGVITEVCDVCAQPTDSEACRSHCKK